MSAPPRHVPGSDPAQSVSLASANPRTLRDARPGDASTAITGAFVRPAQTQHPAPAAFIGTEGGRDAALRTANLLAGHGIAALVVDSANQSARRPRGLLAAPSASEAMRLADAFAGLAFLSAQPEVDAARIVHVGTGRAGATAILTAYTQLRSLFVPGGERFAAHVACAPAEVPRVVDYRTTGAPITIASGTGDSDAAAKRLMLIIEDLRNGGSAVEPIDLPHGVAPQAHRQPAVDARGTRLIRIDPDNALVDERSGRALDALATRVALILRTPARAPRTETAKPEVARHFDSVILHACRFDAAHSADGRPL